MRQNDDDFTAALHAAVDTLAPFLTLVPLVDLVRRINIVRRVIADRFSPFQSEPVDYVEWASAEIVEANDYNPNAVAPPEMELLRVSILADGYTQPIVTFRDGVTRTVVDGFHRNRVGKECQDVADRIMGFLPIVQIQEDRTNEADRMASTVRHNRARGRHKVDGMSAIVLALKRRNWSDKKISKELGMDADEVLRLAQLTGLAEAFKDREFSLAWNADLALDDADAEDLQESNA